MPLPNFAGLSVSRDSTVIPQRQSKEGTIVRPAGFTPTLSSMDVPRAGVAAKKRKRRVIIIAASGAWPWDARSRRHPLDSGKHGRQRRENFDLAGNKSRAR